MRYVPDRTGRFSQRPHYKPEELDRECENIIAGFLKQRYGSEDYPVSTDDLTVLIERDTAVADCVPHHSIGFGRAPLAPADCGCTSGPAASGERKPLMPSPPGPPMTLGNMRSLGVRLLAVTCELCHHEAVLPADRWPDEVLVSTFQPRMACTCCGIVGADARPNWREM